MTSYNPPRELLTVYNSSDFSSSSASQVSSTVVIDDNAFISSANSTTAQLGNAATFQGTYEDVSQYSSITVSGTTDQNGTLYGLFSLDGSTAFRTIQLSDGTTSNIGIHSLTVIANYFAVRYVNGSVTTTTLDIQTIYNKNAKVALPTTRISQSVDNYTDCLNTRAILQGANENDKTFSSVQVTSKNSLKIAVKDPLSAFGEVMVANPVPYIQIDAIYGIIDTDINTSVSGSGTATSTNSLFTVTTGTTINSSSSLQTRRHIAYRPGQGSRIRYTALFSAPVANGFQFAGASNINNAIGFCYSGTTFGILLRKPGAPKIVRLTLTVGSNGTEQITINLNSVAFVFTPTALSTSALAEYIVENVTFTGWTSVISPRSNGSTVTFIQAVPASAEGTYSYATNGGGGGTSAGTFASLQTGVANDDSTYFIPQANWNLDVCDGSSSSSNPSGVLLDKTKLNVFQIIIPYLGAGAILFAVMDPEGHFEFVHQIEYPNNYTIPSFQNPTFTIGCIAQSNGSTTNISVSSASFAGFIEGTISRRRPPFTWSVTNFSAGTTEYVAFALRTRGEFQNIVNYRELYPIILSAGTETSNRVVTCKLYLNATMTGTVNWQYVSQTKSSIEYAQPTTITPSGGTLIGSFIYTSGAPLVVNLEELGVMVTENETIVISLVTASGTAVSSVSINWAEE